MNRPLLAALVLLVVVSFSACGGGSGSSESGASSLGKAKFTITWPARSRLIPAASNSITVTINQGTTQVATQTIARPGNGSSTATVSFAQLPVATLSATATAFPNADGTGTAQATATVPLTIQSNQTTNITLTMASTIASISLTAPNTSIIVGQTEALMATAYNAANSVVLMTPGKLNWKTSNSSFATVDGNGNVTGAGPGSSIITVTDTESQKSGTLTILVPPANYYQYAVNGHWYTAVRLTTLISWDASRAAAAGMTFNGWQGHLVTITSQGENDFVTSHFQGDAQCSYYLGGYQDTSAPDYSEPAGGWRWVTGEQWGPFIYWAVGEPNDSDGLSNYLNLYPPTTGATANHWNDCIDNDGHGYGYIVEFEP